MRSIPWTTDQAKGDLLIVFRELQRGIFTPAQEEAIEVLLGVVRFLVDREKD